MESWRVGYAHAFPGEKLAALSVDDRVGRWAQSLAEKTPRATTLVAERGRTVIGFSSVGPSRDPHAAPDVGEVYAIYVIPGEWSRGVGRLLLSESAVAMRTDGFREATLWVLDDNPRARRAYEAAGWTLDGAEQDDVVLDDVRIKEVRYRVAL